MNEGEHLSLQLRDLCVVNGKVSAEDAKWTSPEGYFLDWDYSWRFENLDELKSILDDVEKQVSTSDIGFDINHQIFKSNYQLYRFVIRNLHRRIEEIKKNSPELQMKELQVRAVQALKEALSKDRVLRARYKGCRLSNFCSINSVRPILSKNRNRKFLFMFLISLTCNIYFEWSKNRKR